MRIEVSNAGAREIDQLSLRLMELNFPRVPNGGTLDAGMFGFEFKGPEWPLDRWPPSFPQLPIHGLSFPLFTQILGPVHSIFAVMMLECSVERAAFDEFPGQNQLSIRRHVPRHQAGRSQNIQRFDALRPGRCTGCKISRATFWSGTQGSIRSK